MKFTFDSSGTPQQVRWFQDGIGQCSYPLASLSSQVTVIWGPHPPGSDTRHPYMVTTANGDGTYTIYVEAWADDVNNPNNQGFPNPKADLYEFYKASVVHELGHVVTFSIFDPLNAGTDPRVQQACGLFWKSDVSSGPGRRYGGQPDWDDTSLSWPNEIVEAVAETFKCTFFQGRPVFSNRTNWNIDERPFEDLIKLITPTPFGGVNLPNLLSQQLTADFIFGAVGSNFPPKVKTLLNDGPFAPVGDPPTDWCWAAMTYFSGPPNDLNIGFVGDVFTIAEGEGAGTPFTWNNDFTLKIVVQATLAAENGAAVVPPYGIKAMITPSRDTLFSALAAGCAGLGQVPRLSEIKQLDDWIYTELFWVSGLPGGFAGAGDSGDDLVITVHDIFSNPVGTVNLGPISVLSREILPVQTAPPTGILQGGRLEVDTDNTILKGTNDRTVYFGLMTPNPIDPTALAYYGFGAPIGPTYELINSAFHISFAVPARHYSVTARYPFAPEFGSLASGPVARGSLALGR